MLGQGQSVLELNFALILPLPLFSILFVFSFYSFFLFIYLSFLLFFSFFLFV